MSRGSPQPTLIACSLGGRRSGRGYSSGPNQATLREEIGAGVRYSFANSKNLATRIRELAAAEQDCCSFLSLSVTEAGDRIELAVTGPQEAEEAIRYIFSP